MLGSTLSGCPKALPSLGLGLPRVQLGFLADGHFLGRGLGFPRVPPTHNKPPSSDQELVSFLSLPPQPQVLNAPRCSAENHMTSLPLASSTLSNGPGAHGPSNIPEE